jgi:hypothetical protein
MRTSTITAIITVLLVPQLMLSACRKAERTNAKVSTEAHQQEMMKKFSEESKKMVAATVNGEAVTMFSLLREMKAIAGQYVKPGQEPAPELKAKIREDALNTLIFQEMAVQEARKRGMKVKPEAIDDEIKKIKADKGSEAGYQEYLVSQSLTENELRKTIERAALLELIAAREVDAKITATDAALRERYKKEKAGLKDAAHRQITFEAAKGMLEQRIRAEAGEKRMREWEKELRKNARIEIIEQRQKQG